MVNQFRAMPSPVETCRLNMSSLVFAQNAVALCETAGTMNGVLLFSLPSRGPYDRCDAWPNPRRR